MTSLNLTSDQGMYALGAVEPVYDWVRNPDGTNSRTDIQSVDESGVPLWAVSTTRETTQGERIIERQATVKVASLTKPVVKRFQPVYFQNLRVEIYYSYARKELVENFTADGIEND